MNRFIPYEKLSKSEKKALNRAKRTIWTMSPVTRRSENPSAYKRAKVKRAENRDC